MRHEKIGIIMKKDNLRNNIIIDLQRRGERVYVIPEGAEMYEIMEKMELGLILLGEAIENSFMGYIDDIKNREKLTNIPIIVILHRNMEQSDMVNILKKGAMDLIYVKDFNVSVVTNTVDKFLKEKKMKFNINVMKIDDINLIKVSGDLDITNTFHFKNKFNELFQNGEKNFIVDIGDLEVLESVGLGVLIYIQKSVTQNEGKIKFIIRAKRILKLLQMVKLDKYFDIYENIDELVTIPAETKEKPKVVVIDDARFMRTLIRNVLEEEGFEVVEFAGAKDAIGEVEALNPDIILCDYEMPEMNGIEFIEKFDPMKKEIPTIMLTTISDINLALKAIRLGASDFLNKPFEKEELVHIMKKTIKANELKKENQRLLIELKRREKELERKNTELNFINSTIEEELLMASEVQRRLLPQELPAIDGFDFAVKYLPSQDIGGDFYDFVKMSNGRIGIAFADISGHGIPAALLATMFKVYLTTYAEDIESPSEAMEILNELINANFPEGKFISNFYIMINTNDKSVKYCKASQEPGLYIRNDGEVEEMITKGQVLGLFSCNDFPGMVEYEEKSIDLKKGEKIFLYTDGIVEAKNKHEEFYGEKRLIQLLKDNKNLSVNELLEKVYGDLLDFLEGLPIIDDLTLLCMGKTE